MATNSNKKPQQGKRKKGGVNVDDVDLSESPYFKMRAIVSLLRPRFLQVLSTPDFKKCGAATEIQEGMKLVMEYYRQMLTEGNKGSTMEKSPRQFAAAEQNQGRQNVKHKAKRVTKKSVDDKTLSPSPISSKMTRDTASYTVGSSLTGWNFITLKYITPPQYYGVTKEQHQSTGANRQRRSIGPPGANSKLVVARWKPEFVGHLKTEIQENEFDNFAQQRVPRPWWIWRKQKAVPS